jgi:diguanylate cyclase (GGDEF)-like protein
MSLCILGYTFEATATTFEAAYNALITEYLAYPFIPPLVLLYAVSHSGFIPKRSLKLALFVVPIMQSALAITSRWHNLYYTRMEFIYSDKISQLSVSGTYLYYICFAYTYVMLCVSTFILIKNALRQKGKTRETEWTVALSFLIPITMQALYLLDLTPWEYDLTPVFLCVTCAIICFYTVRYNYIQYLPAATSNMVAQMRDAFVVVDADGCFVNANPAAKKLFVFLQTARFGTDVVTGHEEYFVIDESENEFEFAITVNEKMSYYKASVGYVKRRGKPVCTTFVYSDITDTKKLIASLNIKASYDVLTGVFNRGSLMRSLDILFESCTAENTVSALLMIDIDHFKRVNDTYGHQCGDETLREVARRIKGRLRQSDIFGRYGGEEFCVAVSDVSVENALTVAESIQKAIEESPFTFEEITFPLTLSIGVSLIIPGNQKTLETVIAEADSALYTAKNTGRNKCVLNEQQIVMNSA